MSTQREAILRGVRRGAWIAATGDRSVLQRRLDQIEEQPASRVAWENTGKLLNGAMVEVEIRTTPSSTPMRNR